mmetsp:Transcript_43006/g.89837  ORF Transcript_43006/g.89837 Transcript_43006/m.89837 type:complete len:360 (+) Transcript_43006:1438-2517(+)
MLKTRRIKSGRLTSRSRNIEVCKEGATSRIFRSSACARKSLNVLQSPTLATAAIAALSSTLSSSTRCNGARARSERAEPFAPFASTCVGATALSCALTREQPLPPMSAATAAAACTASALASSTRITLLLLVHSSSARTTTLRRTTSTIGWSCSISAASSRRISSNRIDLAQAPAVRAKYCHPWAESSSCLCSSSSRMESIRRHAPAACKACMPAYVGIGDVSGEAQCPSATSKRAEPCAGSLPATHAWIPSSSERMCTLPCAMSVRARTRRAFGGASARSLPEWSRIRSRERQSPFTLQRSISSRTVCCGTLRPARRSWQIASLACCVPICCTSSCIASVLWLSDFEPGAIAALRLRV